ncbi:MAG: dTDP-4-amino-4,6-dideoxygalactose transaminase [Bacteroidia bacterium]|nr:dTDP-4-amino-4,6-dideoxygalactose transaminase [Bacteroidia bacterium]MBP9689082.1 dTDP-4-amino-4,6-dideoxygalactose transaminase [Bacteroidia bacterium]
MGRILFNDVRKSDNYTKNIALLFSDYELFRKKHFSTLCINHLNKHFSDSKLFLTHSATGALEMIATLIDIKPGDEIIMPSFTYVSTANAFVSAGATPVFVDINSTTLNIDETLIEAAITPKTKAIIAMHYAGHACNLIALKDICKKHNLFLIEDAAMAYGNYYNNQPLGSIGDFGVISFDITKHISAIQGGLLLVNNDKYRARASNIYHIGTNREDFQQKKAEYYEWVDIGSKYQMNELNAAVLYDDLLNEAAVFEHRKNISNFYYELLNPLAKSGKIQLINEALIKNNIHEFYLIAQTKNERDNLAQYLAQENIEAYFHYMPLHTSQMGKQFKYHGANNSHNISEEILRLPLHAAITIKDLEYIVAKIIQYYSING